MMVIDGTMNFLPRELKLVMAKNVVPFDTQQDRRHESTANRKSAREWYIDYIGDINHGQLNSHCSF